MNCKIKAIYHLMLSDQLIKYDMQEYLHWVSTPDVIIEILSVGPLCKNIDRIYMAWSIVKDL